MNKDRIYWIDYMKLICVFAVYIGHLGSDVGRLYSYVWSFHVQALFFASGLVFHVYNQKKDLVVKKILNIMVPYYCFFVFNYIMYSIITGADRRELLEQLLYGCLGMKALLWGEPLWFLPALLVISLSYYFMYDVWKNKNIILIIGILFYSLSIEMITNPISKFIPLSVPYAMNNFLWYALGAVCKNVVLSKSFLVRILLFACGAYSILFYYEIDILEKMPLDLLRTMILIFAQVGIAKVLSISMQLQKLGKQTLYLCGNETLLKTLVPVAFNMFGINIVIANEITAIIYCCFLFFIVKYIIVLEEPFISSIMRYFRRKVER